VQCRPSFRRARIGRRARGPPARPGFAQSPCTPPRPRARTRPWPSWRSAPAPMRMRRDQALGARSPLENSQANRAQRGSFACAIQVRPQHLAASNAVLGYDAAISRGNNPSSSDEVLRRVATREMTASAFSFEPTSSIPCRPSDVTYLTPNRPFSHGTT